MITFVHTSDWHVGKTFAALADKAGELQSARLSAIDRIAAAALEARASHVLVAGDTFHTTNLDIQLARQPIARMRAYPGLAWHLIPGNHDPGGADLWRRLTAEGLPDNVRLHLATAPVMVSDNVYVLPCPLETRFASADPTAGLADVPTPPSAIRIGLAHGAVTKFGDDGRAAIAAGRAEQAGLAYLALGDWHGRKQIDPRTWYSGTPEPDGYPDNEPGFALIVSINGPTAQPRVEPVRTARFTWQRSQLRLRTLADLDALEHEIDALGPAAADRLYALSLAGELSLTDIATVEDRLDRALAPRLFHFERDTTGLRIAAAAADFATLPSEDLQWTARELAAIAGAEDPTRARVATRALRQLFALTAEAQAEAAP